MEAWPYNFGKVNNSKPKVRLNVYIVFILYNSGAELNTMCNLAYKRTESNLFYYLMYF